MDKLIYIGKVAGFVVLFYVILLVFQSVIGTSFNEAASAAASENLTYGEIGCKFFPLLLWFLPAVVGVVLVIRKLREV